MSDPELFVVRIWHRLATGFRASVRRVDTEQTQVFSQPDELARFLSTPTQTSADSNTTAHPTRANPASHEQ